MRLTLVVFLDECLLPLSGRYFHAEFPLSAIVIRVRLLTSVFLAHVCSIYNKLQQKEAAAGVIEYARLYHRTDFVSKGVIE